MTLRRHDAAASWVHPCHFSIHLSIFHTLRAYLGWIGRKSAKNPIFTKIWRHYVMTQLRHENFFAYTFLYTICIVSEGLKAIGGSTSHREPFFEATSSILPQNLLTFLSHNSGTAGPILDPKVALERQFIELSLRSHQFFYSARNERTVCTLRRKIRFCRKTGFDFATL